MSFSRKEHWEGIYDTKKLEEVSWFQPKPTTSLSFFEEFDVQKTASIIDIGGGDSFLADNLLKEGYNHISVLDISARALERAQNRLGPDSVKITWLAEDITLFKPDQKFDVWHDRAVFHFLTDEEDINSYINTAYQAINPGGLLIIGTFSTDGPTKCSGIPIKQYSDTTLTEMFSNGFTKVNCFYIDHSTPFNTMQNFVFCSFKRDNH
ncbi:class I SAM-dependent methyltransferase [Solitalea canadensis]|uniref:Methyltransferase family protein n=1 Tax=Solitalea canadensis (strain ATCC 29591 / DSM 3403 / JCM 21819 / LMG 8368 / NBRC 15130 / NCIMB 12057 / USAM 9D) TaxID=929556 RepID=H8KXD7_SOLCM|nr:class I SAM-dependent methyltransferase [Solitalea canadensis]AFD08466.1 methyltransferase family protein [Solitalea canadensis DSM 3403]